MSTLKPDAGFHSAVHLETGFKEPDGFQMNHEIGTGVDINVDAGFQFMYDLKTGVHLNPDTGFPFIRSLQGPMVRHGSVMGHGDKDACLGSHNFAFRLFNEGISLSKMISPSSRLSMMRSSSDA